MKSPHLPYLLSVVGILLFLASTLISWWQEMNK